MLPLLPAGYELVRFDEIDGRLKRVLVKYGWTGGALTAGLLIIFLAGTVQLNAVYFHNWSSSFQSGFMIFSWWDLLKLAGATAICAERRR